MACATLKRSLDWESMTQMPAKRRRCSPLASSSTSNTPVSGYRMSESRTSPLGEGNHGNPRLTPEQMAQEICDEIKRLQHRRQLKLNNAAANGNRQIDSDGSSSGSEADSPQHPHSRVLFTFRQVRIICERMLREQEAALRAEYEAALSGKLAEQYEAFVRFNLDQVQRRPLSNQELTYLS